ncbi:MAG: cardiolipin synthase [Pseudomonadota bacterium]
MFAFVIFALVILELCAVYFAWRAVLSTRTSQGAIGWVVLLLAAPYLGVPLFLYLGHHKYRRYKMSWRESERVAEPVRVFHSDNAPLYPPSISPLPFEKIADLPAVRGNDMRLLIDGEATFDAIFAAIDSARSYVLVQFYIVHDDRLGRALQDRLITAAKRGVKVWFFVDAVGSHDLPSSYLDALREAGAKVIDPKRSQGPKRRFQLNFRNHRKTVIVDGSVGFTGGLNVGDEYMGRDPEFAPWRDTHVELHGPVVSQLQLTFVEDWHWAIGEVITDELNWDAPHAEADMTALMVPTGPGDELETGALFFFSAIAAAKKRVWIATPYCVPDIDVLTALKHAALSGVDVRLLVPEVIDHTIPWLAAFAYFDELRLAGVQIWRFNNGFMHQKVLLVDDDLAAIGTTNLDNRSFRLNFEAMALFFDKGAAQEVEAMLARDFAESFKMTRVLRDQPRWIRLGAPVARLFSPVL